MLVRADVLLHLWNLKNLTPSRRCCQIHLTLSPANLIMNQNMKIKFQQKTLKQLMGNLLFNNTEYQNEYGKLKKLHVPYVTRLCTLKRKWINTWRRTTLDLNSVAVTAKCAMTHTMAAIGTLRGTLSWSMFVTFARSVSIQGNYAHTNVYIQRLDCTHVHTGAVPKNSSARSQCGNIPKATPAKNSNANSVTQIKVLPPTVICDNMRKEHMALDGEPDVDICASGRT